jgi:hypothetical protein
MKAKKQQKTTWKDSGHDDLRYLHEMHKLPAEVIVETFDEIGLALSVLEHHLGLGDPEKSHVLTETPIGMVRIDRDKVYHIVEKRQDARERYVKYALATMRDPLEVWIVEYEDDDGKQECRHAYIGAFTGKHQMLVVCAEVDGKLLWNFMQCDSKSLNKHRHGDCVYRRDTKK